GGQWGRRGASTRWPRCARSELRSQHEAREVGGRVSLCLIPVGHDGHPEPVRSVGVGVAVLEAAAELHPQVDLLARRDARRAARLQHDLVWTTNALCLSWQTVPLGSAVAQMYFTL